jgi:hypothetical protein
MNTFEDIGPVTRAEAEAQLRSEVPEVMAKALIALGLHDEDWKWVQQVCLRFLSHDSESVVSAAILSLGHTARINESIDKELVIQALQTVAGDPRYAGRVQDVLDDIDMFVKQE